MTLIQQTRGATTGSRCVRSVWSEDRALCPAGAPDRSIIEVTRIFLRAQAEAKLA